MAGGLAILVILILCSIVVYVAKKRNSTKFSHNKHQPQDDTASQGLFILWIRGRVVRASNLGSKGHEFDSSVRPSVLKIKSLLIP